MQYKEITMVMCEKCGKLYEPYKNHKCGKIEIDCRQCVNCTGKSCKLYGSNAEKAVKSCASDGFKNFKAGA